MQLPLKITCKACHARLEANDPGCMRPDCRIADVHHSRRLQNLVEGYEDDPVSGIVIPIAMGKRHKKNVKRPSGCVIVQPKPQAKVDVVVIWNTKPQPIPVVPSDAEWAQWC